MTVTHILVDFENTQPSAQDIALLRDVDQRLWIFRGPSQKKYDAEFAEALLPLSERVRVIKCEKSGRNALDMHIAFQIGRLLGERTAPPSKPPDVSFVVVSRDTDYEPLLLYVRAQGYQATRVTSIGEALGAAPARTTGAAKAGKSRSTTAGTAAKPRLSGSKTSATRKAPSSKAAKGAKVAASKTVMKGAAKSIAVEGPASIDALADKVVDYLRAHPRPRPTRRDRLQSWLASHLRSKLADGDVPAIVAALEQRGVVSFIGNKIEYPQWS